MNHDFVHQRASTITLVAATRSLLLLGIAALALSACGSNQKRSQSEGLEASKPISLKYEVQRGDSLARIARKLTGDADNWAEIASINGITKPELLQIGLVLTVPDYLIPELAANSADADVAPANTANNIVKQNPIIAEVTQTPQVEGSETPAFVAELEEEEIETPTKPQRAAAKDWVFQASSLPGELEVTAELHRATANRKFNIERLDPSDSQSQAAGAESDDSKVVQMVRVVGTYYPKGVYSQPSYTSTLMMRVAPGTRMELEQSFGDWLQIRTEKGSGYIRSIDAEIMGEIESSEMTLSNNG